MREAPLDIKNESQFYQHLKKLTENHIFYERVEPANESGYPDVGFVFRPHLMGREAEGTIELKFFGPKETPNLNTAKTRGNQKAALIEYYQAGGRRRWVFAYHNEAIYIWDTHNAYLAITGRVHGQRCFHLNDDDERVSNELVKLLLEVLA